MDCNLSWGVYSCFFLPIFKLEAQHQCIHPSLRLLFHLPRLRLRFRLHHPLSTQSQHSLWNLLRLELYRLTTHASQNEQLERLVENIRKIYSHAPRILTGHPAELSIWRCFVVSARDAGMIMRPWPATWCTKTRKMRSQLKANCKMRLELVFYWYGRDSFKS